jgi:hypothetical protein
VKRTERLVNSERIAPASPPTSGGWRRRPYNPRPRAPSSGSGPGGPSCRREPRIRLMSKGAWPRAGLLADVPARRRPRPRARQ